jgi:hypothetical protein
MLWWLEPEVHPDVALGVGAAATGTSVMPRRSVGIFACAQGLTELHV